MSKKEFVPKHVVRIDYNNTHGWQARPPQRKGKQLGPSRLFSDKKHGGREIALEKAQAYVASFGEPSPPTLKNNTKSAWARTKYPRLGAAGIIVAKQRGKPHIQANVYVDGELKRRIWTVDKHGLAAALIDACQFRQTHAREDAHWLITYERALDGRTLPELRRELQAHFDFPVPP